MKNEPLKTSELIFRDLYDSEINFSISCFWDGGFDCALGDEMNGYKEKSTGLKSVEQCAYELCKLACSRHPESWFARKWKERKLE